LWKGMSAKKYIAIAHTSMYVMFFFLTPIESCKERRPSSKGCTRDVIGTARHFI
jgi:hypothetical protein